MQVGLDYYRILMVPFLADTHQIEQAYRERSSLLHAPEPWPGFSSQAVQGRSELLQEAVSVLLDPSERQRYDAQIKVAEPSLEVPEALVSGVLMLMVESGNFRAALDLAEEILAQQRPDLNSDAVLAQAIARLEMGRESWQQGSYEGAASWLQAALADLQGYRAFPEMQAEINTDLGKLRPYRILQLIANPDSAASERQQGLGLLRAMLDERHGIEGGGQDGSELGTEYFLRFIQRVRHQMTPAEQQSLFEAEAERPSMVAAYLAVQVLLARAYVEHRPALVRRAQRHLARLAQRQDVYLEQAICGLLLGQTEEALHCLSFSKESEPLRFIQEQSSGSPDLLPGLCRYTERWFQEEVLPGFRHLDPTQASLQAYFDDQQVQKFLDEMSVPSPPAQVELPVEAQQPALVGAASLPIARPEVPTFLQESLPFRRPSSDGSAATDLAADPAGPDLRRRTSRRRAPARPAFELPPALRSGLLLALAAGSVLVVWQTLRWLFTQPSPQPEQATSLPATPTPVPTAAPPTVGISALDPPTVPTTPIPALAPAGWQGVRQVRVVSQQGLVIRQDPDRRSARVGGVDNRVVLAVSEVQQGADPQIPIWLKVERGGLSGWVAAQVGNTRLVEKLP